MASEGIMLKNPILLEVLPLWVSSAPDAGLPTSRTSYQSGLWGTVTPTALQNKDGQVANPNHQDREPQQKQARHPKQPPQNTGGMIYIMHKEEVEDALNMVIGTFSI